MRLDILTLILLAAAVGSTPTRPALARRCTRAHVQHFLQSLPPERQPSSGMRHESSAPCGRFVRPLLATDPPLARRSDLQRLRARHVASRGIGGCYGPKQGKRYMHISPTRETIIKRTGRWRRNSTTVIKQRWAAQAHSVPGNTLEVIVGQALYFLAITRNQLRSLALTFRERLTSGAAIHQHVAASDGDGEAESR